MMDTQNLEPKMSQYLFLDKKLTAPPLCVSGYVDVSHCDGTPMFFNDEEPSPPVIEEEQDAEEVAYGGGLKVGF